MRRIVTNRTWRRVVPLALVASLVLGGCDDEEEKPPEVIVEVEKDTKVTVKRKEEMIIVAEFALFTGVIVWALFGFGATRRWSAGSSENG